MYVYVGAFGSERERQNKKAPPKNMRTTLASMKCLRASNENKAYRSVFCIFIVIFLSPNLVGCMKNCCSPTLGSLSHVTCMIWQEWKLFGANIDNINWVVGKQIFTNVILCAFSCSRSPHIHTCILGIMSNCLIATMIINNS